MNTLVRRALTWRVAVAGAVAPVALYGTAEIDRHLPFLTVPVLPAGLSGVGLVTLGVIIGRAVRSPSPGPAAPPPHVTAAVARSHARPLTAPAIPVYAVLPARQDERGAA